MIRSRSVLVTLLLGACCATSHPVKTPRGPRVLTHSWVLVPAGAPAQRLAELGTALERCEAGLRRMFPDRDPLPLRVLAYGDRREFVQGLIDELGFSLDRAAYFRHTAAPRPGQGKMLVPPDQSAVNTCHELVHHFVEAQVDREKLLRAKWLDEGTATYLAATIMEPERIREQLGWYRSRHSYVPFYAMRTEDGWSDLHRVERLRSLAYLQAMSLVQVLFKTRGPRVLRSILDHARDRSIDEGFREVIGRPPEAFFDEWLDATRARFGPELFDSASGCASCFLPRATPADVGLDPSAVRRLVEEAGRTRSDTLIVIKDGRLVVERYFLDEQGPIETMSVTKSIVSLAIGMLVAEGKIASVDAPLSTWFPDWKGTGKERVTLRHVLTHTSGLEHKQASGVMTQHADRTRYARSRPLVDDPGRRFSYSNEAVQLLSEVVRVAAGVPLDRYLDRKLFAPLGIKEWSWERDPAGNVQTFYGLALSARDLARIGLVMLGHGRRHGEQIVPESWVAAATSPGLPAFPQMGLLWWLEGDGSVYVQTSARLERLKQQGLAVADRLARLSERRFDREPAYWLEAGSLLGRRERARLLEWIKRGNASPIAVVPREPLGFNANGWQGQLLAVYPRWNLVVVRQRRPVTFTEEENQRYGGWSLPGLIRRLVVQDAGVER